MAQLSVYRWDDPGAPQMSSTKGAALNILKKCLIDGYGDKTPAGWLLESISADNNNMIFAPASRKWLYLIYDDGRNTYWGDGAAGLASIDAYNSIEEPISTVPYADWRAKPAQTGEANQYLNKRTTEWVLLADNETCYFLQNNSGGAGYIGACLIGKLNGNGNDNAYSLIGHWGYYKDYDINQLFSIKDEHACVFRVGKTEPYVLIDPNTGALNKISNAGPVNYSNNSAENLNSGSFSPDGVWGGVMLANPDNNVIASLRFAESAIFKPSTAKPVFSISNNYLYFVNARFYLGVEQ